VSTCFTVEVSDLRLVGARAPDFECSYRAVINGSWPTIHRSPGIVGPESGRPLLLGATSVSALILGLWVSDDFKDWGGGCGADFVRTLLAVCCTTTFTSFPSGWFRVYCKMTLGIDYR
jgi:hypothetical protein